MIIVAYKFMSATVICTQVGIA